MLQNSCEADIKISWETTMMSNNRDLFVRRLEILLSVYFQYGSKYQEKGTLAEFLADDMRETLPHVMEHYLGDDDE